MIIIYHQITIHGIQWWFTMMVDKNGWQRYLNSLLMAMKQTSTLNDITKLIMIQVCVCVHDVILFYYCKPWSTLATTSYKHYIYIHIHMYVGVHIHCCQWYCHHQALSMDSTSHQSNIKLPLAASYQSESMLKYTDQYRTKCWSTMIE